MGPEMRDGPSHMLRSTPCNGAPRPATLRISRRNPFPYPGASSLNQTLQPGRAFHFQSLPQLPPRSWPGLPLLPLRPRF